MHGKNLWNYPDTGMDDQRTSSQVIKLREIYVFPFERYLRWAFITVEKLSMLSCRVRRSLFLGVASV